MRTGKGKLLGIVCGTSIAALAMVSCTDTGVSVAMDRPECPHGTITAMDTLGWRGYAGAIRQFAGILADVPEFHDCQKFLVAGASGREFHALEAVFVNDLDSVYGLKAKANDSSRTTVRTARGASARPVASSMSRPAPGTRNAIALVYSEEDYDHLGIVKGIDCVVLEATTSGFKAYMIPIKLTDVCTAQTPVSPSTELAVDIIHPATVAGVVDKVPAVARWDWDPDKKWHYIGLKCFTDWCELHWKSESFRSSTSYVSGNPGDRVYRVKGWYDEQYLLGPTNSGHSLPDGVFATAVPVPELDARTMGNYTQADSAWVRVAWVSLDAPSTRYRNKLGVDRAPVATAVNNGRRNEVSLCFGNAGKCTGVSAIASKCSADTSHPGSFWYARVKNASDPSQVMYFCVKYRPISGVQPPGVVRWRWKVKDETIWISCPSGCCEIDAF